MDSIELHNVDTVNEVNEHHIKVHDGLKKAIELGLVPVVVINKIEEIPSLINR